MLRNIFILSLLILVRASHADQIEDALCKDEGRFCKSKSQQRQVEKKETAPSGPGWQLIEGEKMKSVISYVIQLANKTEYRDCSFFKGFLIYNPTKTPIEQFTFEMKFVNFEKSVDAEIVEENLISAKPLLRIVTRTGIEAPYDHIIPAGERNYPKQQNYKRELLITTNREKTRIESLEENWFYMRFSKTFSGELNNPTVKVLNTKILDPRVTCNAL